MITRALYSLLTYAAQPWVRRKLARRAQVEPLYGQWIEERFGHYADAVDLASWPAGGASGAPVVWLHAVSLGETRAAAVLLARLREALPGMRLVLTHGTATGREAGKALLQPGDVQVWQPWDTPAAVGHFLARFRPDVGLLMETEVWPNLVAGCAQRGVPLCLVNARMSDKTYQESLRLRWLAGPAYRGLHAVWAQSEADAQRLSSLGATVQGVLGNFKFDATPDAALLAQGRAWRAGAGRPVLMFASSREGEEQMLLDVLKEKWPLAPAEYARAAPETIANQSGQRTGLPFQLLVVPRHPQRFAEVAQLFADAGYTVARRSQWGEAPETADVWVGDSLGEMALYFGMAHVALLGGSFAPLGGQNLIEAAACGVPVFMGPHLFNFTEASTLAAKAGAALRCEDIAHAVAEAAATAGDTARLQGMQDAALGLGAAHRGAAEKTATEVAAVLTRTRR
ncbi:3-deoxy-D-manno-octulosonic acid transferase [Rhodoferax mekongensis]|uniref:3-deoxy-D-manno-octulosonic acid transferase n=1 Tax=Rhodoferax mekongensis TaxID=3068341 RepID=A0ABZ0AYC5_9BURK|nr:3-deoxy-D-manno-octulosonic acid transferase [Rhodoferax sp. TBRC 17307]WNO04495.1 3-deoxy-D-manno-octulosonic acid transferase [Rhodoferax sp. TBRC 17307]